MPTLLCFPGGREYRYFFSCFEQFGISKTKMKYKKAIAVLLFIISCKKRHGLLTSNEKLRKMMAVMGLMLHIKQINNDIQKKYVFTHRPPPGVVQHGVESTFWDNDLFNAFFRFRKEEFLSCMDAMHLMGKYFLCGGKGHNQYFPADICLMIVMRRLAFPSRFIDLVLIFGIPSNRICDIFHSTIDYLYLRYAQKLNMFDIWAPKFPEFAAVFRWAGSPFPNQIAIFDGKFKGLCRPGCLGNSGCRLDQSEMYTGEKSQHGIKYIVAQFPNGMTSLAGPFKGKTHDSEMLNHSCWLQILAKEAAAGRVWILFGDAGFAASEYVQSMYLTFSCYILRNQRTFNNNMSRIRIYIENYFAGVSNVFSFLSFKNGLKLRGRNVARQYEVPNFLMNVRNTFRSNQFTAALGQACQISLEEFLE